MAKRNGKVVSKSAIKGYSRLIHESKEWVKSPWCINAGKLNELISDAGQHKHWLFQVIAEFGLRKGTYADHHYIWSKFGQHIGKIPRESAL